MSTLVSPLEKADFKALEDLQQNNIDMYLCYCGTEKCKPLHHWGPDCRENFVIHLVLRGQGILKMNDCVYSLKENQAFLIKPDTTVYYYQADEQDPWEYLWVGFNGVRAEECSLAAGFSDENPVVTIANNAIFKKQIAEMLSLHKLTLANDLKRLSVLYAFLGELTEQSANLRNTGDSYCYDYPNSVYVNFAVEYLKKNYAQRIKISDLAQYIGISRGYLTYIFKNTLHKSPQEFLFDIRMSKAMILLKNTAMPIKDIAAAVGYMDPLGFSKMFKQATGLSPSVFRDEHELLIYESDQTNHQQHHPL